MEIRLQEVSKSLIVSLWLDCMMMHDDRSDSSSIQSLIAVDICGRE